MALEAVFRELTVSLHRLHDGLNSLQVTIGDKPPNNEAALADGLEGAVLDLLGTSHEARRAATKARKALGKEPNLDGARRALVICQERFLSIQAQFWEGLAAYERLKELALLGTTRGGEWRPWANSVKAAIEECRIPLEDSARALVSCWEEIAEQCTTALWFVGKRRATTKRRQK